MKPSLSEVDDIRKLSLSPSNFTEGLVSMQTSLIASCSKVCSNPASKRSGIGIDVRPFRPSHGDSPQLPLVKYRVKHHKQSECCRKDSQMDLSSMISFLQVMIQMSSHNLAAVEFSWAIQPGA